MSVGLFLQPVVSVRGKQNFEMTAAFDLTVNRLPNYLSKLLTLKYKRVVLCGVCG